VGSWFVTSPPGSACYPGYLALGLTTLLLAAVALLRPPARARDERLWVVGLCLVSICYGYFYRFDQSAAALLALWGRVGLQFLALLSLFSLGQSYAMLPALREVRTRFGYGCVRHPVYALYLLADLATFALQPSAQNAAVAIVGTAANVLRALLEERVLAKEPTYADYKRRVRWRYFPGVF
jgi:protein-S-isoprenylcysteine O-methyltransferase Ste14